MAVSLHQMPRLSSLSGISFPIGERIFSFFADFSKSSVMSKFNGRILWRGNPLARMVSIQIIVTAVSTVSADNYKPFKR